MTMPQHINFPSPRRFHIQINKSCLYIGHFDQLLKLINCLGLTRCQTEFKKSSPFKVARVISDIYSPSFVKESFRRSILYLIGENVRQMTKMLHQTSTKTSKLMKFHFTDFKIQGRFHRNALHYQVAFN